MLMKTGKCSPIFPKHAGLRDLEHQRAVTPDVLSRARVIRGVRNPFDVMTSIYFKDRTYGWRDYWQWIRHSPGYLDQVLAARRKSFGSWIRWLVDRLHLDTVYYRTFQRFDDDRVTHVVRFENVGEDLAKALKGTSVETQLSYRGDAVVLPQVNVNMKRMRDYRTYYDDDVREMVTRVVAKDLEKFEYSF